MTDAPAFAARLCARCGADQPNDPCARCGAPAVAMRWAGSPAAHNWFDGALRTVIGGLYYPLSRAASFTELALARGTFWHWATVDGRGRGLILAWRGRRVNGFGGWLELVEEVRVEVPAPTAAEVTHAGPYAVARALVERVGHMPALDPAHVLLLAAVAHEVARGSIRTWRAERWRWVQPDITGAIDLDTGSQVPLVTWARGRAEPAPAGTLEAAVHAALDEQAAKDPGGALVAPPAMAAQLGAPYRGVALTVAPPPARPIELRTTAIGNLLVRMRAAPASPDCELVADRLALVVRESPFLAAHILAGAENARIAFTG